MRKLGANKSVGNGSEPLFPHGLLDHGQPVETAILSTGRLASRPLFVNEAHAR